MFRSGWKSLDEIPNLNIAPGVLLSLSLRGGVVGSVRLLCPHTLHTSAAITVYTPES